jgi:hypothetical protein
MTRTFTGNMLMPAGLVADLLSCCAQESPSTAAAYADADKATV